VPTSLNVSSSTQTSITLAWAASTDNVGVTGYGRHRNGSLVASGTGTSYSFAGLACGTTYALAVDAYDAAGNRSAKPQVNATTSPCSSGDTQAPTTPGSFRTTGATQTSVSVAWNASSDNTGVSGYGYYRDGGPVANGTGTSYAFGGLACGTSYTLAVDAYDAAGNRSGKAQLSAPTAACSTPPPAPSGSGNMWVDTNGGSCARQAGAGAYNDAQACASFAAAYAAASSGDTVRVRPGTYPAQFFAGGVGSSQGEGTKTLTFVGETGNLVRQIHFGSDNLTFDGIHIDAGGTKTSGAAFENSGSSFTFKNGSIGNVSDEKGAMISGPNMLFDNVLFHDVVLRTAGVHLECIMALWNQGMVIRNSTFRNCGIMDASIGIGDWWSPPPPAYTNVTLENNVWGTSRTDGGSCCAAYSLALWATKVPQGTDYGVLHNWRIVGNRFESGSGVIVRPRDDGSNVICGNSGNVPSASWASACP
jgi:chitodextrinase